MFSDWTPVIGLEIHAQLNTKSKIFCNDSTTFGKGDNQNVSPVSLGMPGALPVVNKMAIENSIKTGLALNSEIRRKSVFSRKNYFYPDLPKGYQISQFDEPICEGGFVEFYIEDEKIRVGITRAHMEEDAGKSTHHGDYSLINLNRAGIPLLEIVSEPDIQSAAHAAEYARTVRQMLQYLDVCDGNLEEGSLRCDCNVSVMKNGATEFGARVEIKNINSFRFVEKAIDYEISRQIEVLESGGEIFQETRLFDSTKNKTYAMRKKEQAHDYRFFPDPDLLPVIISEEWIEQVKSTLPELPMGMAERFQTEYNIPKYDALVLTQEKELAAYFEEVAKKSENAKSASNWVMVELQRELNDKKLNIESSPISSDRLAHLIKLIDTKVISGKIAKNVFSIMLTEDKDPDVIVKEQGLVQISDSSAIEKMVDDVIAASPNQVEQYRGGKDKLFGYFVGQIMKASKGQANPEMINKLLKEKLK